MEAPRPDLEVQALRVRRYMERYWLLTRILHARACAGDGRAGRVLALRSEVLRRLAVMTHSQETLPPALRVLASEAAALDARTLLALGVHAVPGDRVRSAS